MAESTNTQKRARTLFEDLVARVEQFAQAPNATEDIVLEQSRSAEETAEMRLEYELQREVECWEAIRVAIESRLEARREILEARRTDRASEPLGRRDQGD
jgi:hypothetical protein